MAKSAEMVAFEDWLYQTNTPGSRKADSYVYVIERIGPVLHRLPQFSDLPDDLCTINDISVLKRIRTAILAEQKKPNGGIFYGTSITIGYWGGSFCSATIKNLIDFKMVMSTGSGPMDNRPHGHHRNVVCNCVAV